MKLRNIFSKTNVTSKLPIYVIAILGLGCQLSPTDNTTIKLEEITFLKQNFQTQKKDEIIIRSSLIEGKLTVDNDGCLRIGTLVPILNNQTVIDVDSEGLFISTPAISSKFRLGDEIYGVGGGYREKPNLNLDGFTSNANEIGKCGGFYAYFSLVEP